MKLDPILTRASKLARSGKYEAAIRTLEPEVNRYHGSLRYYYLLGSSCLRAGDYGGALTYFRLANETKRRDPLAILGLAVLYLRRGETDRAVNYYLEILETDHKNRAAKKALKVIRKHAGEDAFAAWLEAGNLPSLFPPIPHPGFSVIEKIAGAGILLAACVIIFSLLAHFKVINNPFTPRDMRYSDVGFALNREERLAPLQTGGSYSHEFSSPAQAAAAYERARSFFNANRDEAARIELNRILESNADERLKNRAQIMISFLTPPSGFHDFRESDNVAIKDVYANPFLYCDVHVRWHGNARNIQTGPDGTSFDFLVGNNLILEGIAHVKFNHAVEIDPDRSIEVLGSIMPLGNGIIINLEGVSFYQPPSLREN